MFTRRIKKKKVFRKKKRGGTFRLKPKSLNHFRKETLKGPVDKKLKDLLMSIPGSGLQTHLATQLLEPLKTAPRSLQARAEIAISRLPVNSAAALGLGIQLFKRAQQMRAHSFRNYNIDECAAINQNAEKLLKDAIELGNLQARAALAEMYLSRDKVGIKPSIMKHVAMSVDLVSDFDNDPDCMGVLAYNYFKYNHLHEANLLALHSAQYGSKYGQFVCGLIQTTQRNNGIHNNGACYWFSLAVSQHYDEAQIALAELYSSGKMTMGGTKEEDMMEALRLRELAAEQGNDKAMLIIGYTHGYKAIELKKAANLQQEEEEAQTHFEQSCRWIGFAHESKNDRAERTLTIIKREFEGVKPKKSKK